MVIREELQHSMVLQCKVTVSLELMFCQSLHTARKAVAMRLRTAEDTNKAKDAFELPT